MSQSTPPSADFDIGYKAWLDAKGGTGVISKTECEKGNHPKPPEHFKDWMTDRRIFAAWHEKYHFTLDAAASMTNTLLPRFCTSEGKFEVIADKDLGYPATCHYEPIYELGTHDGLDPESWRGERVFCNPPYDANGPTAIANWLEIAAMHVAEMAFLLLPPSVDAAWFWKYLWHETNYKSIGPQQMSQVGVNVQFHTGRIRFLYPCERCGAIVPGNAPRAGNLMAVFR